MTQDNPRRPAGRVATFALLTVAAVALVPTGGSSHITAMLVYQTAAVDKTVTIQVDFNPTGFCCGGIFHFDTDEDLPAIGDLPDGFVNGIYQNDASGSTAFTGAGANGRSFDWARTHVGDNSDPTLVRITITWTYLAEGDYLVEWRDCCVFSEGVTPVTTSGPVTQKILALDTPGNEEALFFNAGIPECAPPLPVLCYDVVDSTGFLTAPLADYEILLVGSHASNAVLTVLNAREGEIEDEAKEGLSVIAYAQPGADGALGPAHYNWLPMTFGHSTVNGDTIQLTPRGQAHPSHLNQAGATLSNWGWSHEAIFTSWPSYMYLLDDLETLSDDPLAVDFNENAVTLAGRFSETDDPACILASGQPVDLQATEGPATGGPDISPFEAAAQLFRTNIAWALDCAGL